MYKKNLNFCNRLLRSQLVPWPTSFGSFQSYGCSGRMSTIHAKEIAELRVFKEMGQLKEPMVWCFTHRVSTMMIQMRMQNQTTATSIWTKQIKQWMQLSEVKLISQDLYSLTQWNQERLIDPVTCSSCKNLFQKTVLVHRLVINYGLRVHIVTVLMKTTKMAALCSKAIRVQIIWAVWLRTIDKRHLQWVHRLQQMMLRVLIQILRIVIESNILIISNKDIY